MEINVLKLLLWCVCHTGKQASAEMKWQVMFNTHTACCYHCGSSCLPGSLETLITPCWTLRFFLGSQKKSQSWLPGQQHCLLSWGTGFHLPTHPK
uniref:Uncharacterized protein n=1 Tax=Electrophorus electricus TaxID=8005 RepID=A0A4W4FZA2_ELEEL